MAQIEMKNKMCNLHPIRYKFLLSIYSASFPE